MKRLSIFVSGKVQGVFYRAHTEKIAIKIGLSGFVQNENDGRVYIEAQGTPVQLDEFVNWCKEGPDRARVDEIITTEIPLVKEEGFRIKR